MDENQVLCACSAYEQKFYLNPRYESLPEGIKEELKILSVMLTADVGGVFTMEFEEEVLCICLRLPKKMISFTMKSEVI